MTHPALIIGAIQTIQAAMPVLKKGGSFLLSDTYFQISPLARLPYAKPKI